jgi:deoxyribodipyrimidine photolyase
MRNFDGDLSANNGGWQWSASSVILNLIFSALAGSRNLVAGEVYSRTWVSEVCDHDTAS